VLNAILAPISPATDFRSRNMTCDGIELQRPDFGIQTISGEIILANTRLLALTKNQILESRSS
jgi:hypothetical protein